MKVPSFSEGIGVALVGSLAGSGLFAAMGWLLEGVGVFRLVIALLSFVYVIYLMVRSPVRSGRLVVMAAWMLVAFSTWILFPPLLLYLLVHVLLIWLVRILYFHSNVLSAFMDLALSGFAFAMAAGATMWTHSVFLGMWTFFLLQALFVLLPSGKGKSTVSRRRRRDAPDHFEQAHRMAEAALQKLSNIH